MSHGTHASLYMYKDSTSQRCLAFDLCASYYNRSAMPYISMNDCISHITNLLLYVVKILVNITTPPQILLLSFYGANCKIIVQ